MRICWVDDKLDQARALAEPLYALGAEIDFRGDGHSALEALRERPYDLLITDLQMEPGVWGGLCLLGEIREAGISVPSLVLSGEGSQQETIQAMRQGATDYVMKSSLEAELVDRVTEVLSNADRAALDQEESEALEFKSTLRADLKAGGAASKDVEHSALKTIGAFANSGGGLLVVGRADDRTVIGLEPDLNLLYDGSLDAWEALTGPHLSVHHE